MVCIVKFTQSGKTFTKKLLSSLEGATDASEEPTDFMSKQTDDEFTQSGKTFTKKLLSSLEGATDASEEPTDFMSKQTDDEVPTYAYARLQLHKLNGIFCFWFRALLIYINNCPMRCNTKQSIYYAASSLYVGGPKRNRKRSLVGGPIVVHASATR